MCSLCRLERAHIVSPTPCQNVSYRSFYEKSFDFVYSRGPPVEFNRSNFSNALKVKLMLRRPLNQLIAQGIMPPLKTPPAFHEQRQKLERAKMGDLLKAKIQQRPDREELVRQHILEADMGHVDPSLAERQRMLKKARLADSLNDQLSHRPGPLELIKKNILHTEEPIERAVKEGVIPFKATSEGALRKPQHPDHYVTFEEDSQSSEGATSPASSLPTFENLPRKERSRDVLEAAAASAGIVNVAVTIPNAVVVTSPLLQPLPDKTQALQTFAELCSGVVSPLSLGSSTSSLSPLSSIASPPTPLTPRPAPLSSPAPGKADKNRKKSKTKAQPKTRTIKFHEYKGPPNAQKHNPMSASSTETSYELLLQQQQLFLQWQLEWQHKYPQIILPAAQKPTAENIATLQNTISSITSGASSGATLLVTATPPRAPTPVAPPPPTPPGPPAETTPPPPQTQSFRVLTKLEDMKVSDLKIELKRRNLPVSGPKPQLIERLKPFTSGAESLMTTTMSSGGRTISVSSSENPGSVLSEMDQGSEEDELSSPLGKQASPPPASPAPSAMDTSEASPPASPEVGDNIIQQQQRRIEELQRELQRSQQQLQQIRQGGKDPPGPPTVTPQSVPSPAPLKAVIENGIIHIDPKSQQKLILQQHLQNKIQQQQQSETINAKASLAAFINQQQAQQQLNSLLHAANNKAGGRKSIVLGQKQTAIVLNQLNLNLKQKNGLLGHQRTTSLPSFLGTIVQTSPAPVKQEEKAKPKVTQSTQNTQTQEQFVKPPPQYEEATKSLKQEDEKRSKNVKSQIVDDVLEILIKNGELPPSAANDPATPTTPGPPPPPPLPQPGFSVTLPTSITLTTQPQFSPFTVNPPSYTLTHAPLTPLTFSITTEPAPSPSFPEYMSTDNAFNNNDQNFHSNTLDYILSNDNALSSGDTLLPSEYGNGNINLKELGLDLETLDSMDFSQIDCKIDNNDTEMESNNSNKLINNNPELVKPEMMELTDVAMDMDDNWLDSLMPTSSQPPAIATPHHFSQGTYDFLNCNENSYDPLLGNNHDPFDLFTMEDSDIKLTSSLNWDKVDFAT